ncbi:MAG: hypothetical protein JSS10_01485 [Verrucomicrobia bacterium]|nr:hypothetical protein [Verrucomicrobiota bacterium]
MSTSSTIFRSYRERTLPGVPLDFMSSEDAAIYTTIRPLIPKLKPSSTCLPSANYLHAIADASLFLRNIPDAVTILFMKITYGGMPLIGLTSILYVAIGLGWAFDSYKQMKAYRKIGDSESAATAGVQIFQNLFLSLGSTALVVMRAFAATEEISQLLKKPMVFSSAAHAAQTAANWISGISYVIYYAIHIFRLCKTLMSLEQGSQLRAQLLASKDPFKEFEKEVDLRMYHESSSTVQQLKDMALEEGAAWLEKIEKENEVPWKPTLESRKEYVRELFRQNPAWMMSQMGVTLHFENLSPEQKLVRFGRFIADQRRCAKVENDLERLLGPEALEAARKQDPAAFKKALETASWNAWGPQWKTTLKLGLALVGVAALIAGTVLTGGVPLGVLLLLFGVSGIIWIILSDGSLFKTQWQSGEMRKRDKFLIYFSTVLSLVAMGGLITLTALSGGITIYAASLVLAAAWLVVNSRALYSMIDSQRRPWEYQKQPTLQAFHKFTKTRPSGEKIQEILVKMSDFNRKGLEQKEAAEKDWEKAAQAWKKHVRRLERRSLSLLAI